MAVKLGWPTLAHAFNDAEGMTRAGGATFA